VLNIVILICVGLHFPVLSKYCACEFCVAVCAFVQTLALVATRREDHLHVYPSWLPRLFFVLDCASTVKQFESDVVRAVGVRCVFVQALACLVRPDPTHHTTKRGWGRPVCARPSSPSCVPERPQSG